MVTEQVDEELMAGLERRLAVLEAKMPQSAESDAIEGHPHHAIITRVATVSGLPATRPQHPTGLRSREDGSDHSLEYRSVRRQNLPSQAHQTNGLR